LPAAKYTPLMFPQPTMPTFTGFGVMEISVDARRRNPAGCTGTRAVKADSIP